MHGSEYLVHKSLLVWQWVQFWLMCSVPFDVCKSRGRPTGTTAAAGFDMSVVRPTGTTAAEGSKY